MENRKYKINGEDIREVISKEWNLSLIEDNALKSFMEILLEGNIDKIRLIVAIIEKD